MTSNSFGRSLDEQLVRQLPNGEPWRVRNLLESGADHTRKICFSHIVEIALARPEIFHNLERTEREKKAQQRARREDLSMIHVMLKNGVDVDKVYTKDFTDNRDESLGIVEMTLLDIAVKSRSYELVRQLLLFWVDIDKDLTAFLPPIDSISERHGDKRIRELLLLVAVARSEVDIDTLRENWKRAIGDVIESLAHHDILQGILHQAKRRFSSHDIVIRGLVRFTDIHDESGFQVMEKDKEQKYKWI